ncbi:MAG: PAS domain S-box protein [Thermodesulfobacteriota bacterium]|nr:PAS domain S-box protein [Thermodesulfobacteriota bacterium]
MKGNDDLALMQKVFIYGNDPIVIEDLSGNIINANHEAERCYGWSREELIGKPVKMMVPPDRHRQADELLSICREGKCVRNVEAMRKNKTGRIFPVLLTLSPLMDEAGVPAAVATSSKNVSSLKKLIREKEERIKELENALDEAKTLRGILPICSFCKKVRNESGYWEHADVYIRKHTKADVSHGICPKCMKKHYAKELESMSKKNG